MQILQFYHCTSAITRQDTRMSNATTTRRPRKTAAMKFALRQYEFALAQEDRYLGSVFVTPAGQASAEERTRAAYAACKALGMTHEHGL